MKTEVEIKAPYITSHNELGEQYYKMGVITKEEFDLLHGQNWNDLRAELIAEGYLIIPPPPRDLKVEIDELKARLDSLEVSK